MDSTPLEPRRIASTEDLLAHAGWVRAFSRVLLADPHAAADLEQDAWVAALEHRPHGGDGLRGWWTRVLRNRAIDARRTLRTQGELDARAPDESPTPYEATAALDGQRLLVAAIDRLDEPLRTTVVRRFVQGLPSTRIAELDGVPESTVRTRLQRALERLRRDLDDRTPGGRAAWGALLAPLTDAALGPTSSAGYGLGAKLAVAAAIVAAVLLGAYATRRVDADPTRPSIAAGASLEPALEIAAVDPPAIVEDARAPVAAEPRAPIEPAVASSAPEPVAVLTARFVTEDGRAIAGATLTSLDRAGTGEIALDEAPRATSGSDGRVELSLRAADRSKKRGQRVGLAPGSWDPDIEAGGRGWAHTEVHPTAVLGSVTAIGDVVLPEGADVRGRCIGADGAPLAALRVEMVRPDLSLADRDAIARDLYWNAETIAYAVTSADGTYLFEGAPVGAFRIHVSEVGLHQAVSDAFELRAADELRLPDLVVRESRDVIRGVVLLPDGTPCTSATLESHSGDGSWLRESTEEDGTFLIRARSGDRLDLCATTTANPLGDALALDVAPGSEHVVLQLTEPRWIDVLVVDEAGAPVEEYALGSSRTLGRMGSSRRDVRPGGRSRALVRARPTYVSVSVPGYVQVQRGPYSATDAPAALTIELARAAVVRGAIRRGDQPVPDAEVSLSATFDVERTRRDALPQRVGKSVASTMTDADGSFLLCADRPGRHVVWSRMRDGTVIESGVLELALGSTVEGIVLDVLRTGTLAGRVTTRDGADSQAAQVILSNGLPEPRTIPIGSDGTFVAAGLAPGTWSLRVAPEPRNRDELLPESSTIDDPTLRTFEIEAQRTTHVDVDLRALDARAIGGSVRLDGRAPARWIATLVSEGEGFVRRTSAPVRADGSFHVASEWFGGHTLALRSSGTERRDDRIEARVEIGARATPWVVALETGSLDLTGPPNEQRELRVALANGAMWITNFRFDAEGRALLDGLPRGTAVFRKSGEVDACAEATITGAVERARVP